MPEPWPRCDATSTFLGEEFTLTCVLPKGHLMDGQQMHEDEKGNCWAITLSYDDGREERR